MILTPREYQVAELLATTDLPQRALSADLGLHISSFKRHAQNVYRKLGVNRILLAQYWRCELFQTGLNLSNLDA